MLTVSLYAVAKPQYEGYCTGTPTVLLRENFGSINIYGRTAQTLLTKASGYINDYDFTLNPYRGCQYGCSYCYAAAFSPNQKMRKDWGKWVIIKENGVELLQKELAKWHKNSPSHPPKIYMSSVTDPYQPIEAKVRLTRSLLEVMVTYQPILVIQTRSPMIIRDIDILKQFKKLRINISIPTYTESVRKDFEPQSPSIKSRLQTIGKLKHSIPFDEEHEVKFSVTVTPVLPICFEQQLEFIQKLAIVDRVVIQEFHEQNNRSLIASTRQEAIDLKKKYDWWFQNEYENYHQFKIKLENILFETVEVLEGRAGFGYE